MRPLLLMASLLLIPSLAVAETADVPPNSAAPRGYVQAGLMFGAAAPVTAPNLMTALEGGLRLGNGPGWVRAAAAWGGTGDDQGPGSNLQLRAGFERRGCWWHDAACGVGGLDAGYQRGHWADRNDPFRNESSNALVVIPRLGVDLGGRSLRARLGLELDYGLLTQREVNPATDNKYIVSRIVGVEANAGIAYQW